MSKNILFFLFFISSFSLLSQEISESQKFWNTLKSLCGNAYEGKLELPKEDKQFGGKKLLIHIKSCSDNVIKVPLFVGEDKSRVWIFTYKNNRIELKHQHSHADGTQDKITMYGGTATNDGQAIIQVFPADEATKNMLPQASTNIWWVSVNNTELTYNLRRLGTDTVFKIVMDLTKQVKTPSDPWGWEKE